MVDAICVGWLVVFSVVALATCSPSHAQDGRRDGSPADVMRQQPTEKQIEYGMLNEWRKEIVRLQYTDFCASVKALSPQAMAVLQQVIAQGEEAKHPVATELKAWFERIGEQYASKGCGDA